MLEYKQISSNSFKNKIAYKLCANNEPMLDFTIM